MRLVVILICFCISISSLATTRAFTIHPKGKVVKFYLASDLRKVRIAVYPYKDEFNAGIEVKVMGSADNSLRVEVGDELLYCHKGDLAINTRNYDGSEFILYKLPDRDSEVSGFSSREQTLRVYNISGDWLFVKGEDDKGRPIEGWIPPEMQCPSVWTTCN